MTPEELKKNLKATFGGAIHAVSWADDGFDFYVIPQVPDWEQTPDETVLWIWPDPGKNIRLVVLDIEINGDEWTVTTPEKKWSFRPMPEEIHKPFIKAMRAGGLDG